MSHRRKNAHPTNKLRRTTVPESPTLGSSASTRDAEAFVNSKMVSQAEDLAIHRDSAEPATPPVTPTFPSTLPLPTDPPPTPVTLDATGVASAVPSHLALPPDLWEDFQALQAATHLDTAALIRRLIHQYGKTGSQADNERPSSATDTDTTICADDHASSSPGGGVCGDTTYYSEQPACLSSTDMTLLAASTYMPPTPHLQQEEDCLILDLSSGSRDVQHPPSTATDVRVEVPDEAEEGEDVERPLDLTVSKVREFSHRRSRGEASLGKAPEAHRTPSNTILLSALSHGMMPTSAAASSHPPKEAHSALSGVTPSPRPVSSSLFNLSELPLVVGGGQRVSSVAQTEQCQNKLTISSSSRYSEELPNKQKIVQQFLSLPAGHFQASEVQHASGTHEKQEGVLRVMPSSSESFRHLGLSSVAAPYLTASPPTAKCADRSQTVSDPASSSSAAMQLPTVTSLEFQGVRTVERKEAGGGGQGEVTMGQSAVAVTLSSLPTSGSAILLDVSSGGVVAGAGGGLTGVSTLNIPFMATGSGGLVAIPLLHTLPEAFAAAAAAAAAAANQGQLPTSSTTTPSSVSQHSPPPPSQSVNDLPPPPPYSAAVAAASTQPKKYKAKLGRPRGQPKTQKAVPKDMKLLTENTLFPGVYTSILKLPWSKRSRGKSSMKIKDVIGKSSTPASAGLQEQPAVAKHRELGEVTAVNIRQKSSQQEPSHSITSSSSDAAFSVVPMPVFVPDQTSATSTVPHSSSSSSSVMMVYHNTAVSELGKPVRKRGRPPKLPVLSQLLTESMPYCDRPPEDDQPTPMDTGSFSLIPLAAHPAFDASTVAFPTNVLDASVSGFAAGISPEQMAGIKQEPMEVTETPVSKLFSLAPALLERKEDPGHPHHDRQIHPPLKQEPGEATMGIKSGDLREAEKRHAEAKTADLRLADVKSAEAGDTNIRNTDAKDSDTGGRLYGCPEVAEARGEERKEGHSDSFQDSETRFHMLANQLGLEIGSPYHTSLVYGQSPTAAAKNFLYQPIMLPSQTMVEMKPCRRQLNNLIKPSDDCVYTSFRIRPRNSGRRGGKRGGRRRGGGSRYNTSKVDNQKTADSEALVAKEACYKEGSDGVRSGSAVITERIPGAGEVPQRLYQDLYHCKVCNELLPVDNSLPHTCAPPRSPPLCSCDVCGTMFLSTTSMSDGSVLPKLCEDCTRKSQSHLIPGEDSSQDQTFSEGFACQPCGVHFVNISDYIQHRRTAHLEKMSRQARKTHTLKTLPCPARGCPRLFHMHAELSRHLHNDHPEEVLDQAGTVGGESTPTPSPSQQEGCQDVDVETIPDKETDNAEDDIAQFPCSQADCGQRFSTAFQLLEHVQACHEDVNHWPCPLPGCSRQFGTERHLRVHLLMHREEKPLKCPFCPYRCRQKNALHWHMRKHPESASQYRKFPGMSMDS